MSKCYGGKCQTLCDQFAVPHDSDLHSDSECDVNDSGLYGGIMVGLSSMQVPVEDTHCNMDFMGSNLHCELVVWVAFSSKHRRILRLGK